MKFISFFPNLKELILINNEINLDKPNNKKIIEDIKKEYKNLNLVIEETESINKN